MALKINAKNIDDFDQNWQRNFVNICVASSSNIGASSSNSLFPIYFMTDVHTASHFNNVQLRSNGVKIKFASN